MGEGVDIYINGTARSEISCHGESDLFGFTGLGRQARICVRIVFLNMYRQRLHCGDFHVQFILPRLGVYKT